MKRRIRVLIADNDKDFSLLLTDRLTIEENVEIAAVAADGETALELCEKLRPDVLLIDLVLPKLDGLAVIERLARTGGAPAIHVVSAFYNELLLSRCADMGVLFFTPKPCCLSELVSKISRSWNEPRAFVPSRGWQLEDEATELMHELGIPAHIKGYHYLREAILLTVNDAGILSAVTKRLYPTIAERFSTTPQRVEKAIRRAIESAWDRGDIDTLHRCFGYTVSNAKGKPTNSEFIALIADRLRLHSRCRPAPGAAAELR